MGFRPETILYLTIENNQILGETEGIIRDTLEVYEKHVLEASFREAEEPIFVFVDEIQKADGWAETLKYYTDTYSNILFIVTGSVSTLIRSDASETLVGRLEERIVMPFKFVDLVDYFDVLDQDAILEESTDLRSALDEAVKSDAMGEFTEQLAGFYGRHTNAIPELTSREDEYLLKGGYPGVLDRSYVDAYSQLDTNLRYTVTGDLANVFDIQKEEKVLKVLSLVADATTGKINVQNIADTANINRDTVERYLDSLEEFFLISRCPRHSTSEYRRGGHDKIYVQDVGLYNTLQGTLKESTLTDGGKMGPILETAVADHARRLQFHLSDYQNAEVGYWDRTGEVDFVLSGSDYTLPIEVKHGDSTAKNLRGLRRFIDESDAPFGLAINKAGELQEDDDIIHVPSWLFFFLS